MSQIQHPFVKAVIELLPKPSPLLTVSYNHTDKWISFNEPSLWVAIISTAFNPLFWNIVARQEYHNKLITKLTGGRPYLGCYLLALTIFSLGIVRDHLFKNALSQQPNLVPHPDFPTTHIWISFLLFSVGQILVVTSMFALGITGTYLGDYFGILMRNRVTSFPFNVVEDPMYIGSTICFLATSIWYRSPAGLAITLLVFVEYQIALRYEGPFTAMIYSSASSKKEKTETPLNKSDKESDSKDKTKGSPPSSSTNSPAYRTRSRARKVIEE